MSNDIDGVKSSSPEVQGFLFKSKLNRVKQFLRYIKDI